MIFNTFIGLKLKKIITKISVFIASITIFFLLIDKNNDKNDKNIENSEIIYNKNEFNDKLIKKRVRQTAPVIKIKVKVL